MLTPPRLAPAPASPPPRRHIAVHPTLPYCLTCSDDMLIKLWDWDKGWACTQVFEGHSHYVMQLVFNPKGAVWVQYGGGCASQPGQFGSLLGQRGGEEEEGLGAGWQQRLPPSACVPPVGAAAAHSSTCLLLMDVHRPPSPLRAAPCCCRHQHLCLGQPGPHNQGVEPGAAHRQHDARGAREGRQLHRLLLRCVWSVGVWGVRVSRGALVVGAGPGASSMCRDAVLGVKFYCIRLTDCLLLPAAFRR